MIKLSQLASWEEECFCTWLFSSGGGSAFIITYKLCSIQEENVPFALGVPLVLRLITFRVVQLYKTESFKLAINFCTSIKNKTSYSADRIQYPTIPQGWSRQKLSYRWLDFEGIPDDEVNIWVVRFCLHGYGQNAPPSSFFPISPSFLHSMFPLNRRNIEFSGESNVQEVMCPRCWAGCTLYHRNSSTMFLSFAG